MNTRVLATHLITDILRDRRSLSHCLAEYKSRCKKPEDAAFLQALVFGVIRWYPRLNFISEQLLQKPIKEKDIKLYYLILIGLYQLTDMRVAEHAAISETVETARRLNMPWATSLINAVLRSYQRQATTILASIPENEAAWFAHPSWLIDNIKSSWPEQWQDILYQNNTQAPLSLRVNRLKVSRTSYLQILKEASILATPIEFTDCGITLQSAMDVSKLPGYNEGLFSVQDGAAQLAAPLLQLSSQLRVLDACAAPGGKTTHILELEPNLAECVALDIASERTQKITENLTRLGLKARVKVGDAADVASWWDGKLFDRILLDVPCSAVGVIRRHPDIKYLRQAQDIAQLTQHQLQLLKSLWPLLKPGGLLLYATCSIFPEENIQVVRKFLKTQSDANSLPVSIAVGTAQAVGQQILPGQHEMDGFYYALLEKKVDNDS